MGEHHRQNIEAELGAMLLAGAAVLLVATGLVWAVVLMADWWLP